MFLLAQKTMNGQILIVDQEMFRLHLNLNSQVPETCLYTFQPEACIPA